ncbi:MAG TPA: hypothetical protein VG223_11180 [Solirubrobacteraceae bacterium]|nr:hypothetical protein [Solirubrobacteraceae bacterium]
MRFTARTVLLTVLLAASGTAVALGATVTARPPLGPGPVILPGKILGTVDVCGGKAPGRCRLGTRCGAATRCREADRVVLVRAGAVIASARLRSAHFSWLAQPGRYMVLLLGARSGRVLLSDRITVREARTTKVALRIEVK